MIRAINDKEILLIIIINVKKAAPLTLPLMNLTHR